MSGVQESVETLEGALIEAGRELAGRLAERKPMAAVASLDGEVALPFIGLTEEERDGLVAYVAASEARVAELEAALKPFAETAEWADRSGYRNDELDMLLRDTTDGSFHGHLHAQMPDFRRAADLTTPRTVPTEEAAARRAGGETEGRT